MYGHWQSGTRKLNKHWQSAPWHSIFTAKKSKTQLTYAASLGNVGGSTSEGTPPSLTTEREKNAWEIWIAFKKLGYSEQAVSGMLGNIDAESGIIPDKEQIGGPAYGLVQWDGSAYPLVGPIEPDGRKYVQNLLKEAKISGDYTKNATQIKLLEWCMYNGQWIGAVDPLTVQGFKSETSVNNATLAFLRNFERAGVEALAKRQEQANYWYSKLHGLGNVGGKEMYSASNSKQGKVYRVKYGVASKVDVVSLGGTGMKYMLDNGDELKDSTEYFLGFQITAYRYITADGTEGVWGDSGVRNGQNYTNSKWFIPKTDTYIVASQLSNINQSSAFVTSYKNFSNKLKHDTSQFGNSKFVGNSDFQGHLWKAMDGACVLETGLEKVKPTGDDTEVLCEDGFMDYLISINGDYFLKDNRTSTYDNKEIPKIGVTMVFGTFSTVGTPSSRPFYLVTPTIYDSVGDIADLSDN